MYNNGGGHKFSEFACFKEFFFLNDLVYYFNTFYYPLHYEMNSQNCQHVFGQIFGLKIFSDGLMWDEHNHVRMSKIFMSLVLQDKWNLKKTHPALFQKRDDVGPEIYHCC